MELEFCAFWMCLTDGAYLPWMSNVDWLTGFLRLFNCRLDVLELDWAILGFCCPLIATGF